MHIIVFLGYTAGDNDKRFHYSYSSNPTQQSFFIIYYFFFLFVKCAPYTLQTVVVHTDCAPNPFLCQGVTYYLFVIHRELFKIKSMSLQQICFEEREQYVPTSYNWPVPTHNIVITITIYIIVIIIIIMCSRHDV